MIKNENGEILFYIEYSAGYSGTDVHERGFFENEDEAVEYYLDDARSQMESYMYEDEDEDDCEVEVDICAYIYDPDEHDCHFHSNFVDSELASNEHFFAEEIKGYKDVTGEDIDPSLFGDRKNDTLLYLCTDFEKEIYFRAFNRIHACAKITSMTKNKFENIAWELPEDGQDDMLPTLYSGDYVLFEYNKEDEDILLNGVRDDIKEVEEHLNDLRKELRTIMDAR